MCPFGFPTLSSPTWPRSTCAKAWETNGYKPSSSILTSKMPAPPGATLTVWTPFCGGFRHVGVDPRPVEDRADDVECRLERRARGDDVEAGRLAGLGCEGMRDVLVRVAVEGRPVGHHRARLLHAQRGRLRESPSLFMYHSLATSTYSWSTFGSAFFGLTTMAPYIPLAMCASTGFVPQ